MNNLQLLTYVKKLKIPYFRGVFMRDQLPSVVNKYETGIVNLDNNAGNGTHWVAYIKRGDEINYYDSFGVEPPLELMSYFSGTVYYNYDQDQRFDQVICGNLCLKFLYDNYKWLDE